MNPICEEASPGVMLKIEPSSELVDKQLEFWNCVPPAHRPQGVWRIRPDAVLYSKVQGVMPDSEDAALIWSTFVQCVWTWPRPFPSLDTMFEHPQRSISLLWLDYSYYCESKGASFDLLQAVATHRFSPSRTVHGDATVENLLLCNGTIVFLDPGRPVIRVRELDESKLLQSWITQWEALKSTGPIWESVDIPFPIRYVHIAMLYSHWIRLMAHRERNSLNVLRTGREYVVPVLESILKETPDHDSELADGHRRRLDELQASCLGCLPPSVRGAG